MGFCERGMGIAAHPQNTQDHNRKQVLPLPGYLE